MIQVSALTNTFGRMSLGVKWQTKKKTFGKYYRINWYAKKKKWKVKTIINKICNSKYSNKFCFNSKMNSGKSKRTKHCEYAFMPMKYAIQSVFPYGSRDFLTQFTNLSARFALKINLSFAYSCSLAHSKWFSCRWCCSQIADMRMFGTAFFV